MLFVTYTFLCFGSLFSIVDPFAAVPIFLALLGQHDKKEQAKNARRAAFTCFLVLSLFALAGSQIFKFFGFTMAAFKIAGGILLFGVGLEMMRAHASDTRGSEEERKEAESKADVGLIPLGIPLLSGPGAIAAAMVLSGQAKDGAHVACVLTAIFMVSVLSFFILRSSSFLGRALGTTGLNVISRLMGLMLSAIAIQFVLDGSLEAFPALAIGVLKKN